MTLAAAFLLAATFTRAMERVVSMDPHQAQSIYDSSAVQLVYETPLVIDYTARPYRLKRGICELPEISADGLTYVFRMVPVEDGGSALTAADIVRSLARLRDPAQASPGGWTMREVESIRATDARTVEIRLRRRFHVFPWMMAMSYAGISDGEGKGTGAYCLADWRKNHEMRFVRRPESPHWRGLPGPSFDQVRYLVVSDPATQWLMFMRGELDYMQKISRDNWDAVVGTDGGIRPELAAQGIALYSSPALEVFYLGFNMKDPVLGENRKLRQALSCAFDGPTWRKFLNNSVDLADGPVPLGVAGRLETPFAYAYDLARAKALLAEAGYPEGIDPATGRRLVLTLSIGRPDQTSREQGELVASFFERLGVRLELSFSTWSSFLDAVNHGHVQMYFMGWVGDYPDAENFLQMFHSRNVSPGANHSLYVNPAFDAAYDAAMDAADAETRDAYWRRCQEILREDCPWIYTHYPRTNSLLRERVRGFVPGDFPYGQEKWLRVNE